MQREPYCHAAVLALVTPGVSAALVLVHCRVVRGGIMHALVTWTEYKLTSDADHWLVLLVLTCFALPCPALPCPAPPRPALPCPALPRPVLPCPALALPAAAVALLDFSALSAIWSTAKCEAMHEYAKHVHGARDSCFSLAASCAAVSGAEPVGRP